MNKSRSLTAHTKSAVSSRTWQSTRRARLACAVAAGLCLAMGASSALAQQRIDQRGDALDRNPQVGGTGSNVAGFTPTLTDRFRLQNQIVTGQITGGRQFRDFIGYTDPFTFQGGTGGQEFDAFLREASGVTTRGTLIDHASAVRPFYGVSTTARVPGDYVRTPFAGGYLPPRALTGQPLGGRTVVPGTSPADMRLDTRIHGLSPEDPLDGTDLRQDRDLMPRPPRTPIELTDIATQQAMYRTAPPAALFDLDADPLARDGRTLSPYTRLARDARMATFGPERLTALREELLRDAQGELLDQGQLDELLEARRRALDEGAATDRRITGQTPRIDPMNIPGVDREDERLLLAGPADQSEQFAQLRSRLERFDRDPAADRLGLVDRQRRTREMPTLPGLADLFRPTAPEEPAPPELGGPERDPDQQDPPVSVRTLTAGVASPTLAGIYEEAEELMTRGRFVSAIARYEVAERLVPNQPLTILGRATAELGAGYYRRAAVNLRRAFLDNRELMMARVDVASLLGEQRMGEVTQELRRLAASDRQTEQPLFLLAFLSYGAGDYEQAAAYLELAEQRSDDPFYALVRQHWGLAPESARPEPAPGDPEADGPADAQPDAGNGNDLAPGVRPGDFQK